MKRGVSLGVVSCLLLVACSMSVYSYWDGQGNHKADFDGTVYPNYGLTDFDAFALRFENTVGARRMDSILKFSVDTSFKDIASSPYWDIRQRVLLFYPPLTASASDCFLVRRNHPVMDFDTDDPGVPSFGRGSANFDVFIARQIGTASIQYQRNELFRTFYFKAGNLKPASGQAIDGTETKVIVLIHGWNPDAKTDAYNGDFATLKKNVEAAVKGTPWKVLTYHWEPDAATGPVTINGYISGARSAEIGHLHGQHLGQLLLLKCPSVQRVQFIAHSAGAWTARAATRFLMANSSANVQITLLDPFMPAQGGSESVLGRDDMSALDELFGARLSLLENYFAYDASDWYGYCTSQSFAWRGGDINKEVNDNLPLGSSLFYLQGLSDAVRNVALLKQLWLGHGYPVREYAAWVSSIPVEGKTVSPYAGYSSSSLKPVFEWQTIAPEYGWGRSMFFGEYPKTAVPDQTVVEVYAATNSPWPPLAYSFVFKGNGSSGQAYRNMMPGSYFWVTYPKAKGIQGLRSETSGVFTILGTPGTPTAYAPVADQKTTTLTYSWSTAGFAEYYRFYLKENGKLILNGVKTLQPSYVYTKHRIGSQYEWQVRAARVIDGRELLGPPSTAVSFAVVSSQALADVDVNSGSVSIYVWDYSLVDGDRVDVYVNDVKVLSNISLTASYQGKTVALKNGRNLVKIAALNEGSSSPNTAAIYISNVTRGPSSQSWSLHTGGQATLSINAP